MVDFCAKAISRSGSRICILGRILLAINLKYLRTWLYLYLAHAALVLQLLHCFGDLKEKKVIMKCRIQVVHT